ncbi:MAG: hypothetical protein K2K34_10535 [Oscillospiraceae bacterium]|nr:hypothetical protein [Oscillospiraceae bacterium]
MEKRFLYLVLTRTGTLPSKIIGFVTGKRYTHVSIASDEMLTEMYSFCRDKKEAPLPAGFNREDLFTEVFGACKTIPGEVYRLPVTDEQLERYKDVIRHFILNRGSYSYDVGALLPMALHIPYKLRNRFVCSVWVGFVLGKSGVKHNIDKQPSLIEPEDFRSIEGAELVYRGDLKKYRDYITEKNGGTVPLCGSETA